MKNQNLAMNQTSKNLVEISKAENLPYSGINKRTLKDNILEEESVCRRNFRGSLKLRNFAGINFCNFYLNRKSFFRRHILPIKYSTLSLYSG